jgi:hypothetical protein
MTFEIQKALPEYKDYICKNKCNTYLCLYSQKPWYKIFQNKCDDCGEQFCKFCNILIICYDSSCTHYMKSNCVNCFCIHQKKIFQDVLFDTSCNKSFKHVIINRFRTLQRNFLQIAGAKLYQKQNNTLDIRNLPEDVKS